MAGSNGEQINSQRALARAMGRALSTVQKWLKDDRWTFERKPPWPKDAIPRMQTWAVRSLRNNDAAAESEPNSEAASVQTKVRSAKLRVETERGNLLEMDRREREGALVDRDTVTEAWALRVAAVRLALGSMPRAVGPSLVGLDSGEIVEALETRCHDILRKFAEGEPLDDDDKTAAGAA